ncbi:MAG: ABC transporter permease [Pseudomonadota bacterium]|nr:ABC transporter permease [Pseudomonadota bacterium]
MSLRNLPAGTYVLALFVFIYLPVLILVLFSFQDGVLPVPPFKGPSLQWYERMISNGRLTAALFNSVIVAVLSAIVSTVLGFLAAYSLARRNFRFASAARFFLMAPITVSYLIIGMGLLITFNMTSVPKSLFTVGLGHVIINLPICFSILFSQLGDHQRNLERAAEDLGASQLQAVLFVTVPILRPALFAAFCIAATLSWDEFIVAFMLSRFDVTLPVIIFEMLRAGLNPEVNAAGTVVFAISITTVMLALIIATPKGRRNA